MALTLAKHGKSTTFKALEFTFPLKLMAPRMPLDPTAALQNIALVYMLTYGGGVLRFYRSSNS